MPYCCAYNCNERATKGGFTFHSFPKDEKLKKKWCEMIRRENFTPSKYSKLCGKHFQETDFEIHFGLCKLKKGVVPSIFQRNKDVPLQRKPPVLRTSISKQSSTKLDTADEHVGNSAVTEYHFLFHKEVQSNAMQIKDIHTKDTASTKSKSTNSSILDTVNASIENSNATVKHVLFDKVKHSKKNSLIIDIKAEDASSTSCRNANNLMLNTANDGDGNSGDTEDHILFHKDIQSNNTMINDINRKDAASDNTGGTESLMLNAANDGDGNSGDTKDHILFHKDIQSNNTMINDINKKDAASDNTGSTESSMLDTVNASIRNSNATVEHVLLDKVEHSNKNSLIIDIKAEDASSTSCRNANKLMLNTAKDGDGNSGDTEDHILFHKDIQSNNTMINDINQKDVASDNTGGTERITENPVSSQRKNYAGDYKLADMSSPTKAKKFYESATASINKKNRTVKTLHQKNRRLEIKVKDLESRLAKYDSMIENFNFYMQAIHNVYLKNVASSSK